VVVSGPGGVGKGTVVAALRAAHPDVAVSVSATTRAPRAGEVDGVHYRFVDDAEFQRMVDAGEFVEWAEFNGRRYGTPWSSLHAAEGQLVLEIDVQGARQIRDRAATAGDIDATLVFLEPPSWAALEERLRGRGSETPESLAARLAIGREEMAAAAWFDHRVVNTTVAEAVEAIARILGLTSEGAAGPACPGT
jgi:guanylate kinase